MSDTAAAPTYRATVIVLNYNGRGFLETCLRAVVDQRLDGGHEVIVVDNASSDGSADYVRSAFPSVRVIESDRNRGFAGGNNLGMRAAQGHYLVLLNNDTRARPGWLEGLVAAAESERRAGAITGKLVFMHDPGTIQNAGILLLSDGSGADRGFHEADRGQYDQRQEVFGACGASVLYRREMLEDVGSLDETFFLYYEDTDLSWRMRLRGWTAIYEPTAVVEHVHAGSSREWSPLFTFHVDRNRLFMIVKNAPASFAVRAIAGFAGRRLRLVLAGPLRRRVPSTGAPSGAGRGRRAVTMRVMGSFLVHMPEMLAKRRRIRARQTVDDAAITRWFYPRELWDRR